MRGGANFKVMEIDIDDVSWKDDIVTHPPVIENGEMLLPTGPGWGADVNEEFVQGAPAAPVKQSADSHNKAGRVQHAHRLCSAARRLGLWVAEQSPAGPPVAGRGLPDMVERAIGAEDEQFETAVAARRQCRPVQQAGAAIAV